MKSIYKIFSNLISYLIAQNKFNINPISYPIIIIGWVIAYFFILLNSGFSGDDIWNAQIKGQLIEEDISLLNRINNEWKGWFFGNGSIRILYYFIIYPAFYITQDPLFYKYLTLFFLITSSLLFYYYLSYQSENKYFALIVSLFLPTFFQFREWNDPILGFPSFMMPFTVSIILLSIIFYIKYIETLKNKFNYISSFLMLINILIYEIAVPFFITYIVISKIKLKKLKMALIQSKLQIIITSLYLSTVFFINNIYMPLISKSEVSYTAVKFHHSSLSKLTEAFLIQITGGMPLSYLLFSNGNINLNLINVYEFILLLTLSFIIYVFSYKFINSKVKLKFDAIVKISLIFILAPTFLTALSGHQGDLRFLGFGNAYIPVYIQYFGTCALLISLIFISFNKLNLSINFKSILIALIFLIISSFNYASNKEILNKLNRSEFLAANIVTSSLIDGIMDNVKENSLIFRKMITPSDYYRNYISITGKKYKTCELGNIDQRTIDGTDNYKNCVNTIMKRLGGIGIDENINSLFYEAEFDFDVKNKDIWISKIFYSDSIDKKGYVVMGKIKQLRKSSNTDFFTNIIVDELNVYKYKDRTIKNYKKNNLNFIDILEIDTLEYQKISNYLANKS